MTRVKIVQAVAGMVVGRDVTDRNGRVLLRAGNVLNSKHLRIFKSWGIAELTVTEAIASNSGSHPSPESTAPADSAPENEMEQQLSRLFRFNNRQHPAIRELFDLALQRKKERAS